LQSLYTNTTGGQNTAVGYQALYSTTTASYITAIGYQAGKANTTGSITAVGGQVLTANTTGVSNTAMGGTYVPNPPMYVNTTGSYNCAFGDGALTANTTASSNTAVGYQALQANTTASENTAVGYQALYSNPGARNAAFGSNALGGCTGTYNVGLGAYAGGNAISGSSNILIGYQSQVSASADNYEIVINASGGVLSGKGGSTGYIYAGGGGTYQGNNSAAWSVTSDQRLKKNIVDNNVGLDKVAQIQVRNFEYRTEDEVTDLPKHATIKKTGIQLGVIAQELQQVLPDCVKEESTGVLALETDNIMWHMINAIKELNAKVTALEAKLGA
jgi:hypothetical protein